MSGSRERRDQSSVQILAVRIQIGISLLSLLSNEERETIIRFDCTGDSVKIYTCQRVWWARLEKIEGFALIRTERLDGQIYGKEFECPKSYIRQSKRGLMLVVPAKVSDQKRERCRKLKLGAILG